MYNNIEIIHINLDYLKIRLRPLLDTEEDMTLFARWYQNPDIYSHFVNKRLNKWDIEKRINSYVKTTSSKRIYVFSYDGEDIGAIEYHIFNQNSTGFLSFDSTLVYQLQFFLGNKEYQNKGITSMALELIANRLFNIYGADLVVASVPKSNLAAYKCCRKAGFRKGSTYINENNEKCVFLLLFRHFF